jgi:hypothetical protein
LATICQGPDVVPTVRLLRVPVLGAFEALEYGSQGYVSGGFVLLYATSLAGEFSHAGGEPRATPCGQYAPGEDAVGQFEGDVLATALEQIFEGGVEGFGVFKGEGYLDFDEVFGFALGLVAAQAQRRFSR